MAFKSRELMFGFSFERDPDNPEDPDQYVVLRLGGCDKLSKWFVSCGETQNKARTQQANPDIICDKCALKDGNIQVTGSAGLRSLREALKNLLDQLEPAEKDLLAFEADEAQKAAKPSGSKAAKAPAKKATKSPAKKAPKPPTKKR